MDVEHSLLNWNYNVKFNLTGCYYHWNDQIIDIRLIINIHDNFTIFIENLNDFK